MREVLQTGVHVCIIGFITALILGIAISSYMHVMAKTGDVGILRAHGVPAMGVAWIYTIEMLLLVLPACVLGLLLARVLARLTDTFIARALSPDPSAVPSMSVFYSGQSGLTMSLLFALVALTTAALAVLLTASLTVHLIKRMQIVDALRGGGG